MKAVYFDLTVRNLEKARKFFEDVLGWRFEKFPLPYDYYRIWAGSPDEPGIDGGVGEIKDSPVAEGRPMTLLTIPVDNLDETIESVKRNGGSVVEPKTAIPGIGWFATCTEPGGLKFGLIQPDPQVQ